MREIRKLIYAISLSLSLSLSRDAIIYKNRINIVCTRKCGTLGERWFDCAWKWGVNSFCEKGGQGSKISETQLSSFKYESEKIKTTKS